MLHADTNLMIISNALSFYTPMGYMSSSILFPHNQVCMYDIFIFEWAECPFSHRQELKIFLYFFKIMLDFFRQTGYSMERKVRWSSG